MNDKPVWRPLNPGRKKIYGEKTTVMRVPASMAKECREWLLARVKEKKNSK